MVHLRAEKANLEFFLSRPWQTIYSRNLSLFKSLCGHLHFEVISACIFSTTTTTNQVDDIAEKINYLKNISHWIEKLIDFNGPPSSISAVENRHFTHILCFFWVDSFSALHQLLFLLFFFATCLFAIIS
jgi:hypothetical protein